MFRKSFTPKTSSGTWGGLQVSHQIQVCRFHVIWIQTSSDIPKGTTHNDPKSTQLIGTWQEVTVGVDIPLPWNINPGDQWSQCSYVIAGSGDKCKVGSWVFFKTPCDSSPMIDEVCVLLVK